MHLSRLFLILALTGTVAGCAGSSLSRSATLDLHQKLGRSRVAEQYPEEYQSFIATVARAETLAQREDPLSENVYRLALLKGRLLETRAGESGPSAAAPRQQPVRAAVEAAGTPSLPPDSGHYLPRTEEPDPTREEPSLRQGEQGPVGDPATAGAPGGEAPPAEAAAVAPADLPVPPAAAGAPDTPPSGTELRHLPPLPGDELPAADMRRFIGDRGSYTVRPGDTLRRVGARLGVDWRRLARINGLDPKVPLTAGQLLVYDNRKIVPAALRDGIVVNIADRTLYLLRNGIVRTSYPVAVGKPPRPEDDEDWSTPTGRFVITSKVKDPVWRVPQSIQDEMEEQGKEPVKEVPPGRKNPLGKYAMKTSLSGIVIHSTNSPSSIYSFASHGCIRVMPEHMERLFPSVEARTPGVIVYQPVKLAVSPEGRVFLEVNRDVYDRYKGNLEGEVRRLVSRRKVDDRVDWKKIDLLIRKKSGIPEEITRDSATADRLKPAPSGRQRTVSVDRARTPAPPP